MVGLENFVQHALEEVHGVLSYIEDTGGAELLKTHISHGHLVITIELLKCASQFGIVLLIIELLKAWHKLFIALTIKELLKSELVPIIELLKNSHVGNVHLIIELLKSWWWHGSELLELRLHGSKLLHHQKVLHVKRWWDWLDLWGNVK